MRPKHDVEMFRLVGGGVPGDLAGLPNNSQLAVLPGTTHVTLIYRVDFLEASYTQDGRNGRVYLDKQYRISLNSLEREEIQSPFISTTQGPINDIGLNHAMENALLKLLAALPLRYRNEAEQMRQRIHFDPSQWFYQRDVSQWMPQLLDAVFADRKLSLQYLRGNGTPLQTLICPYGLVAKMDIWYLVAMTDEGDMRTFRVSRFTSLQMLDETFQRSSSFDLATYWKENTSHFQESKPRYIVELRLAPSNPSIVRYLQEAYGAQSQPPDREGWIPLTLTLSAMQEVRMVVMGMGNRIKIIEPSELRDEVRQWLKSLQDHYGT